MAAGQTATTRSLNQYLEAQTTASEITIVDRATQRPHVSAGVVFLRSGSVILDMVGLVIGDTYDVKPPDEEGNPDTGMVALLYTAATTRHPYTNDTPIDVKVTVAAGISPTILENLGAIGVEEPPAQPVLTDGNPNSQWDGYPRLGAKHIVYTFGQYFDSPELQSQTAQSADAQLA